MAKSYTFYSRAYPPDKWTCIDLLYWLAMKSLPETYFIFGELVEGRESLSVIQENPFNYGSFFSEIYFDPEETSSVGLKIDPRWENEGNSEDDDKYLFSSEHHERMSEIVIHDDPIQTEIHRTKNLELAKKAKELEKRTDNWLLDFSDHLDRYRAKIIIDLRDGVLTSEGIRVKGKPDGEDNDELYENFIELVSNQKEYEAAFEDIPSKYWVTRRVDWDSGLIKADEETFLAIRFNIEDVLKCYPPASGNQMSIHKIGNVLVKSDHTLTKKPNFNKRGRPSKNWEQVQIKIAEVIAQRGGLPKKQDSFAEELADWYRKKFNTDIGLTTLKSRLKPYYDNSIFQKSE